MHFPNHNTFLKVARDKIYAYRIYTVYVRKATTSHTVGPRGACMCGDGCMSRDGGFKAVRAAGENIQIFFLI